MCVGGRVIKFETKFRGCVFKFRPNFSWGAYEIAPQIFNATHQLYLEPSTYINCTYFN